MTTARIACERGGRRRAVFLKELCEIQKASEPVKHSATEPFEQAMQIHPAGHQAPVQHTKQTPAAPKAAPAAAPKAAPAPSAPGVGGKINVQA